jgi:hypothetical protein
MGVRVGEVRERCWSARGRKGEEKEAKEISSALESEPRGRRQPVKGNRSSPGKHPDP